MVCPALTAHAFQENASERSGRETRVKQTNKKREQGLGHTVWVLGPGPMLVPHLPPPGSERSRSAGRSRAGPYRLIRTQFDRGVRGAVRSKRPNTTRQEELQTGPDEGPIGVTGATGAVGSMVAKTLARRGIRQRLVVRDVSRALSLNGSEVVRASSYGDGEGMKEALVGTRTLFLISAKEAPDRVQQHQTAVDAAVAAGVERIVYLSFLGAARDATFTFARQHFNTEEHVRSSGVAFTFLRSSGYADFIPYLCQPDGAIRAPGGSGRIAPVSRADIADVVEVVLTTDGHEGRTYDLTGPTALSLSEIADRLSRAAGRAIRYEEETVAEAMESRKSFGAPDWELEGWVTSYLAIAAGEMDVVSDAVPKLSGHQAQTLDAFLHEHPESYEHLMNVTTASA